MARSLRKELHLLVLLGDVLRVDGRPRHGYGNRNIASWVREERLGYDEVVREVANLDPILEKRIEGVVAQAQLNGEQLEDHAATIAAIVYRRGSEVLSNFKFDVEKSERVNHLVNLGAPESIISRERVMAAIVAYDEVQQSYGQMLEEVAPVKPEISSELFGSLPGEGPDLSRAAEVAPSAVLQWLDRVLRLVPDLASQFGVDTLSKLVSAARSESGELLAGHRYFEFLNLSSFEGYRSGSHASFSDLLLDDTLKQLRSSLGPWTEGVDDGTSKSLVADLDEKVGWVDLYLAMLASMHPMEHSKLASEISQALLLETGTTRISDAIRVCKHSSESASNSVSLWRVPHLLTRQANFARPDTGWAIDFLTEVGDVMRNKRTGRLNVSVVLDYSDVVKAAARHSLTDQLKWLGNASFETLETGLRQNRVTWFTLTLVNTLVEVSSANADRDLAKRLNLVLLRGYRDIGDREKRRLLAGALVKSAGAVDQFVPLRSSSALDLANYAFCLATNRTLAWMQEEVYPDSSPDDQLHRLNKMYELVDADESLPIIFEILRDQKHANESDPVAIEIAARNHRAELSSATRVLKS